MAEVFLIGDRGHGRVIRPVGGSPGSVIKKTSALCGAPHNGGYKAGFQQGITEIGCAAHARRKFFDLRAKRSSQIAGQALPFFAALYDIERETRTLEAEERRRLRQSRAKPVCDALHEWMATQRKLVAEGSAIAKALDYRLKRWEALTRYLDDRWIVRLVKTGLLACYYPLLFSAKPGILAYVMSRVRAR